MILSIKPMDTFIALKPEQFSFIQSEILIGNTLTITIRAHIMCSTALMKAKQYYRVFSSSL